MKALTKVNKRIKRVLAASLAVIVVLAGSINVYASPREDTEASLRATKGDYYADQWVKWQDMMDNYIPYEFDNTGLYSIKSTKVYAREIVGLYDDGSYIIGPWKLVHTNDKGHEKVKLPGDCVSFAFSYDIVWGTDWPYSGVFWDKIDTRVNSIKIYSWGEVRTPGLNIRVNNKTIFDEYNLSSHNEWHP